MNLEQPAIVMNLQQKNQFYCSVREVRSWMEEYGFPRRGCELVQKEDALARRLQRRAKEVREGTLSASQESCLQQLFPEFAADAKAERDVVSALQRQRERFELSEGLECESNGANEADDVIADSGNDSALSWLSCFEKESW